MKNIFILFMGIALLSLNACTGLVEDINTDPNNPTDAPIETILNAALVGTIIAHEGEDARLGCMWAQQFTGSDRQYAAYEFYGLNAEGFDWDKYYLVGKNSDLVIEKAAATDNKLASGIAKVLKAHSMGTVAALWGNVPFSEALQFPVITDPIYDGQAEVYAGCQRLLDEAIADLSAAGSNPVIASTDFYFSGDTDAWIRVANNLKARYAMHTGDYSAALAAAPSGITEVAQSWLIPHTNGAYNQDQNIYYSFGVNDREGYMTAQNSALVSMLNPKDPAYRGDAKTDESARFASLFVVDSTFTDILDDDGNVIGVDTSISRDLNYGGWFSATQSFPLIHAAETHLIIAEAYHRTGDMDNALAFLNSARVVNAEYWGGTYDAYDMADFADGAALLTEILEEKYVSLVGQIEVYNDIRRTDNAIGITPRDGNATIPERYLYPQAEIDANVNTPDPIPGLFAPTPVNQ